MTKKEVLELAEECIGKPYKETFDKPYTTWNDISNRNDDAISKNEEQERIRQRFKEALDPASEKDAEVTRE